MFKHFKILLLSLVLVLTITGCSTSGINKDSVETQGRPVAELSESEVKVAALSEVSPIKKGTRVDILWAFSYVRYNGQSYEIKIDKEVKKRKLGKEIGEVIRFLPATMVMSGEPFVDKDGDSNYLSQGSLIYEYKGKDINETIIVNDKGVYREAILHSN